MNCTEFENAIDESIETRTSLEPRATTHVATCPHCNSIWAQQQQLNCLIDAWRLIELPSGLTESVMSQLSKPLLEELPDELIELQPAADPIMTPLRPEERVTRGNSRTSLLALASVAACLIVVTLAFQYEHPQGDSQDRLTVSSQTARRKSARSTLPYNVSNTLVQVLADIRTEYREIASETHSAAREIANSIPQPLVAPVMPDTDEIEFLPESNEVERVLNPIGSGVTRALSFLLLTIPTNGSSG